MGSRGNLGREQALLFSVLISTMVLPTVLAIKVYTANELYGRVGSKIKLSCSFWSNEWISDDISITWHFQPESGKDSTSIFHYAKGQDYIDNVGLFKERIEWIGDPHWKDGSIIIHNLEYTDNGTYTCDVKNPPDIVGRTSQVTLYVFENVPTKYGQVLGGIIGGVLLVVFVVLVIAYLIRYCWLRRQATLQRRLSAMEKGKLRLGRDSSKRRHQTPVLYAMLDHSRFAKSSEKKSRGGLCDIRRDKK